MPLNKGAQLADLPSYVKVWLGERFARDKLAKDLIQWLGKEVRFSTLTNIGRTDPNSI